jgi:hypothetical protein
MNLQSHLRDNEFSDVKRYFEFMARRKLELMN